MKNIFIIVPRFDSTGPVKGAYALCNSLSSIFNVHIVSVKPCSTPDKALSINVSVIPLGNYNNIYSKLRAYSKILQDAGKRIDNISISICLSADILNSFIHQEAIIYTSIRSNLIKDYQYDYGYLGVLAAILHFRLIRRFDSIIAMTNTMAKQVKKYSGKTPIIIGNFIDESSLESFRLPIQAIPSTWRFIYVGSLSTRKQVDKLVYATSELISKGHVCSLDLLGEGPNENALKTLVSQLNMDKFIHFHGHVAQPVLWLRKANCLVLPSMSEGVSRAVLEALYLGVPCILRDVDANHEIIDSGKNGVLFNLDSELPDALVKGATLSQSKMRDRSNLLKRNFRQDTTINSFIKLIG